MNNKNVDILERKALIFNVQKYNTFDGPGVRTLVFFKGCPLRCRWCANPEGLEKKYQVMFKINNCINCGACVPVCPVSIHQMDEEGVHQINRQINCIGCRACVDACLTNALNIMGEEKNISEILDIIEEDRQFYETSGGGVTLGGGEVLAQHDAAKSLLMACKQSGIHTAIETSGYTKKEKILDIAEYVDLFLFDIKHMDPKRHIELTGVNNEVILGNLKELLTKRFNVHIRMPLLKGINDSNEEIEKVVEFLTPFKDYKNFQGIDLLPYHKMGVGKYTQLDMEYPIKGDPSLSEDDLNRIESIVKSYDFPVNLVRH